MYCCCCICMCFSAGDVLAEIQTDKAIVAFETEEEGTMAKILTPEATSDVPVGQIIGVMAELDEDWKTVPIPTDLSPPAAAAPSLAPPPPPPTPPPQQLPVVAHKKAAPLKSQYAY